MADTFDGIPEEYQSAVNKIIGERLRRDREVRDTEWKGKIGTLEEQVTKLKPLAENATQYKADLDRFVTRAERDRAYPQTLAGEDKAPIRERLERLYDAEIPGEDGSRPAFADWLAADPLASAIVGTAPAAPLPGGGGQGTPQQPAGGAAPRLPVPPIGAGAGNPAASGPKPTPQQHKATHAALLSKGDVTAAAAYLAENMTRTG